MKDTEGEMISLLSRDFKDNTRDSNSRNAVAVTWLISFEQIKRDDPKAAEILFFLAFIKVKEIPLSILPSSGSREEFTHAVGTLIGYSFLTRQGKEGQEKGELYDMHRLVHRATKIWMQKGCIFDEWAGRAVDHMVNLFSREQWASSELWQVCVPHMIRALQETDQMGMEWMIAESRTYLCLVLGLSLAAEGRTSEAIKWPSERVAWTNCMLREDDLQSLTAKYALAVADHDAGKLTEAIELLETVVTIEANTLAENHPELLEAQRQLARVYMANGEVKRPTELLEKVVSIESRIHDPENLSRLSSVRVIGTKSLISEDNPWRHIFQYELVMAYRWNGRMKEAINLLEKVIVIQTGILAANHISVLRLKPALASLYNLDKQSDMAVKLSLRERR